jgi:hypothetical protein
MQILRSLRYQEKKRKIPKIVVYLSCSFDCMHFAQTNYFIFTNEPLFSYLLSFNLVFINCRQKKTLNKPGDIPPGLNDLVKPLSLFLNDNQPCQVDPYSNICSLSLRMKYSIQRRIN